MSQESPHRLYQMRLWAWKFKRAETKGIGATIARAEGGHDRGAPRKDDMAETGKIDNEKRIVADDRRTSITSSEFE